MILDEESSEDTPGELLWIKSFALVEVIKKDSNAKRLLGVHLHHKRAKCKLGMDEWILVKVHSRKERTFTFSIHEKKFPEYGLKLTIPMNALSETDMQNENSWMITNADGTNIRECSPPDNLADLTHVNNPAIVLCLYERYKKNKIYTRAGSVLLVMNPCKQLLELHSEAMVDKFRHENSTSFESEKLGSGCHVFATANRIYWQMLRNIRIQAARRFFSKKMDTANQIISVSGETGAGKSTTVKHLVTYLANLSYYNKYSKYIPPVDYSLDHQVLTNASKSRKICIEEQILSSMLILESFGNARTGIHDNSSRYGLLIKLNFEVQGLLTSAKIQTYLLDTLRLIVQSPRERNFHIFYELLIGDDTFKDDEWYSECKKKQWFNEVSPVDFQMLCHSGTYDRRDGGDRESFRNLFCAMKHVGFTDEEVAEILTVVTALLYASNLTFVSLSEDECKIDPQNSSLEQFQRLLGVDEDAINNTFCRTATTVFGKKIRSNISIDKAENQVKKFIQSTYLALFMFLVRTINMVIKGNRGVQKDECAYIAVLEGFSFERLGVNSFNRLCRNYLIELQEHSFKVFNINRIKEDYLQEGLGILPSSFISQDKGNVLDLMENPQHGILTLLDKSEDDWNEDFAKYFFEMCVGKERFQVARDDNGFYIEHFFGKSLYNAKVFVYENSRLISHEISLLRDSHNSFVNKLSECLYFERAKHSSRVLRYKGCSDLQMLTQYKAKISEILDNAIPHYVRCFNPNTSLIPEAFSRNYVHRQIDDVNIIEALNVSKVGFTRKYSRHTFYKLYQLLMSGSNNEEDEIIRLLSKLNEKFEEGGKMGRRKVFLKRHAFYELERMRREKMHSFVVRVQAQYRMTKAKIYFRKMQELAS